MLFTSLPLRQILVFLILALPLQFASMYWIYDHFYSDLKLSQQQQLINDSNRLKQAWSTQHQQTQTQVRHFLLDNPSTATGNITQQNLVKLAGRLGASQIQVFDKNRHIVSQLHVQNVIPYPYTALLNEAEAIGNAMLIVEESSKPVLYSVAYTNKNEMPQFISVRFDYNRLSLQALLNRNGIHSHLEIVTSNADRHLIGSRLLPKDQLRSLIDQALSEDQNTPSAYQFITTRLTDSPADHPVIAILYKEQPEDVSARPFIQLIVLASLLLTVVVAAISAWWAHRYFINTSKRISTALPALLMKKQSAFPHQILELAPLEMAIAQQADERLTREADLLHQALHDPATKRPNRPYLERQLTELLAHQKQVHLITFCFPEIEDIVPLLGPNTSDQLMREVAKRLCSHNPDITFFRTAFSQYSFYLINRTDDQITQLTEEYRNLIADPIQVNQLTLTLSLIAGIAATYHQKVTALTLLNQSELAARLAIQEGDSSRLYSNDFQQTSSQALERLSDLEQAIEQDKLFLHFQPVIDSRSKQLTQVECLIRWDHHRNGILQPNEFIPVAIQSHQIHRVTQWLIAKALSQCRSWANEGLYLPVSINVSSCDILTGGLVEWVQLNLTRFSQPPSRFIVEIDEEALMQHRDATLLAMKELHQMGIRITLDNFTGAGFPLTHLTMLPVDEVKISRSLLKDWQQTPSGEHFLRLMINACHQSKVKVVAKGIEDAASAANLTRMGCDCFQGFHFSQPLEESDLRRWLNDYNQSLHNRVN